MPFESGVDFAFITSFPLVYCNIYARIWGCWGFFWLLCPVNLPLPQPIQQNRQQDPEALELCSLSPDPNESKSFECHHQ